MSATSWKPEFRNEIMEAIMKRYGLFYGLFVAFVIIFFTALQILCWWDEQGRLKNLETAFRDGGQSRRANLPAGECPFRTGSELRRQWLEGWIWEDEIAR